MESSELNAIRDIFISYKADTTGSLFGSQLRDQLLSCKYSVYFNPHEKKSDDFKEKLRGAVEACTDLVLIATPSCIQQLAANNKEDYIRFELDIAHKAGKNIVPIMVGDAKFPDKSALPESLRFLPDVDNITFPATTEYYYESPFAKLLRVYIKSKPEGWSVYRDTFASNPDYDMKEDVGRLEAEAKDSREAMFELAVMLFYGIASKDQTVKRDYAKAARLLEKVGEGDDALAAHAKNMLAHLYYCGEMPMAEQSYDEAYRLHREASAHDVDSAAQRAFQERVGCGCEFDFKTCEAYYRSVVDKGDDIARMELAQLYTETGRFPDAIEQYRHMSERSPEAAYKLGMLYKRGVHVTPPEAGLLPRRALPAEGRGFPAAGGAGAGPHAFQALRRVREGFQGRGALPRERGGARRERGAVCAGVHVRAQSPQEGL